MLLLATTCRSPWSGAAAVLTATVLLAGLAAFASRGERPAPEAVAESARDEELEWSHRAVRARMARKEEVIRAVTEGRMSLLEAAARFGTLNRQPPAVRADLFCLLGVELSDEERLCRSVLSWAADVAELSGSVEGTALRARLEAELRRARLAGLRLPAVEERPLLEGR
jgi:hypothetical protein